MPRLGQIIKGVQVNQARKGQTLRPHLPIIPSILQKIKSVWLPNESSPDKLMLWAASTTAPFGFCHSGEITISTERAYNPQTHLSFSNLAVKSFNDIYSHQAL